MTTPALSTLLPSLETARETTEINIRRAWAELAVVIPVFEKHAGLITRRVYPQGSMSFELDFERGGVVVEIYHHQDYDFHFVSLDAIAQSILDTEVTPPPDSPPR